MSIKEVISQLSDLVEDRKSFISNDKELNNVFLQDIQALQIAIEYLKKVKEIPKEEDLLLKLARYQDELEKNLTFEEISKVYREILYKYYENFTDEEYQKIRTYQLLRTAIDIFSQMVNKRVFEENYLIDRLRY